MDFHTLAKDLLGSVSFRAKDEAHAADADMMNAIARVLQHNPQMVDVVARELRRASYDILYRVVTGDET